MNPTIVCASRAEELGPTLVRYFAMPAFYNRLLLNKAAILEGGRGCGKTTVLKSLSFEANAAVLDAGELAKYWHSIRHIGCYVKMDSNVVSSFTGKGLSDEDWTIIFAHFINLRLIQQVLKTLSVLIERDLCNLSLQVALDRMAEMLSAGTTFKSLNNARTFVTSKIDEVLQYVNNPRNAQRPIVTNNGTVLFETCRLLVEKNDELTNRPFFMLIDEYESLRKYQQIVMNTLIKVNEQPVIFKIAVRPKGWFTRSTLTDTECLQEEADFDKVSFENISDTDYKRLVKEIYYIRLRELGIKEEGFLNIETILPAKTMEEEAADLFIDKSPKYPSVLRGKLEAKFGTDKADEYLKALIDDNNHIIGRLNFVLYERGHHPEEIIFEKQNNTSKYRDWYDNNKMGVLFMLCREASAKKIYAGFDTYCLLSSKIIRHFVCLFNRAYELACKNGFSIENIRAFSVEEQNRAAFETSMNAVMEIESLPQIGTEMQRFVFVLGRIFEEINKDPRQSEPERTHIGMNGSLTSEEALNRLNFALLWSVLHEEDATKLKAPNVSRGKDYILSRIYSPYFQISHRKKRKLELSVEQFQALLIGSNSTRKMVSQDILRTVRKKITSTEEEQLSLEI